MKELTIDLSISLTELNNQLGKVIFHKQLSNDSITVRELQTETAHYRWFHRDDDAIQSVIDVNRPRRLLMPVYQAMLLPLLWHGTTNRLVNLANLGMGAGGIERSLEGVSNVLLTSIEQCAEVIDLAREYFYLSPAHLVEFTSAESFLNYPSPNKPASKIVDNDTLYDVIFLDIFVGMAGKSLLTDIELFQAIKSKLKLSKPTANRACTAEPLGSKTQSQSGIACLNLSVTNQQELIEVVQCAHQVFTHSALIDFADYKNIVLFVSDEPFAEQQALFKLNQQQLAQEKAQGKNNQYRLAAQKSDLPQNKVITAQMLNQIDFSEAIQHLRIIK